MFGGKNENPEEKKLNEEARNFDRLKYDGVKAVRTGQNEIAIKCLKAALEIKEDLEVRDYLAQALARNGELLPKAQYDSVILADGDSLEVVSFVGGG